MAEYRTRRAHRILFLAMRCAKRRNTLYPLLTCDGRAYGVRLNEDPAPAPRIAAEDASSSESSSASAGGE